MSIIDVNLLLPRLREGGIFYQSYLGLELDENGDSDNLFITSIDKGSPADQAGLRRNDRITAIDGKDISNRVELTRAIYPKKPGMEIFFTILRDGKIIIKKIYLPSPSHYSKPNNSPRP